MVANGDAELIGKQGSSRDISNTTDRELIVHLRNISDVYVTGGNTARLEHYKTPVNGKLAVISRDPLDDSKQIWVNPPQEADPSVWCITELKRLGFSKILLEVGPSLASRFLQNDLVDEFCLTVTNGTRISAQTVIENLGARLQLADSFEVEGTLFTRWRRGNE